MLKQFVRFISNLFSLFCNKNVFSKIFVSAADIFCFSFKNGENLFLRERTFYFSLKGMDIQHLYFSPKIKQIRQ
jgi:hypothetical protein